MRESHDQASSMFKKEKGQCQNEDLTSMGGSTAITRGHHHSRIQSTLFHQQNISAAAAGTHDENETLRILNLELENGRIQDKVVTEAIDSAQEESKTTGAAQSGSPPAAAV